MGAILNQSSTPNILLDWLHILLVLDTMAFHNPSMELCIEHWTCSLAQATYSRPEGFEA